MNLKRFIGGAFVFTALLAVLFIGQLSSGPSHVKADVEATAQAVPEDWHQIVVDGQVYTVWGRLLPDGRVDWPRKQPRLSRRPAIPAFETNGVRADKLSADAPTLRASDPETRKMAVAQLAKVEAAAQDAAGKVKPCPEPPKDPEKLPIPHPLRKAEADISDYVLYGVAAALVIASALVAGFTAFAFLNRSPPPP